MSHFRYPVVRVYPTHSELVSEHLTKADAEREAAYLDLIAEAAGIWHLADEPCCQPDYRQAN